MAHINSFEPPTRCTSRLGFLILLIALGAFGFDAQAQEEDFGGYYSIGIEHKLTEWLEGSLTPELRFLDNHSRLESALIDGDLKAKLNDYFDVGAYYRFAVKQPNPDELERVHRYGIYGKAKYRLKPIDLSYRCLYFEQFTNYNSSPEGTIPDKVLRHKVMASYSKKKYDFEPFAYGELYQSLAPEKKDGRMKLKLSVGVDYKINKKLTASFGYLNQQQFNVNNPITSHIITSELKIKL